ncbi:MAG: LPS export ABC transporter permease LptF [Alphaproteobacteria bacterium]|nr:LPS export ABC transporter permease LptF [Alphaproteobacteria bacterium]
MSRADRYIFQQLAGALVFIAIALAGVVWLSQSLRFVDLIINRGLSITSFVMLTLLLLPTFLVLILPIALFCAVLYTYHRLANDRELVVLRACGVGPGGLTRPVFVVTGLVVVQLYAMTLYLMPAGYRSFKDQQFLIRDDLGTALLQEGAFNNFGDELTVYVRLVGASGEASGILVHDDRDPKRPVTMMAEHGALLRGVEGPRLLLVNGNRQEIAADRSRLSLLYFDRYTLDLSTFFDPARRHWREPRERYFHELLGPHTRKADIRNAPELLAEAHQRLVLPWVAPALALIAVASLLTGELGRRDHSRRLWGAIIVGAGFEGAYLFLERAIIGAPGLIPILYLWILGGSVGAWLVLRRHRWRLPSRAAPSSV